MAARRGPRKLASWCALGLVALAWWSWLRPTTLGGAQTYIVVDGHSMEPTYDDGDLVLVREEQDYAVGDIVAFRAGGVFEDPTRIIHRIVGRNDDGSFATQGDNRPGLDPWRPTPDDVIGRAVVHVPHLGEVATTLARPPVLAALGGGAAVLGRRRRRRRRPVGVDAVMPAERPMAPAGATPTGAPAPATGADRGGARWVRRAEPRWAAVGLAITLVLAVPTVAAAWSAVRTPTTTARTEEVGQVEQRVDVDYRFLGTPSPVYPSGVVATTAGGAGTRAPAEPLFSKLLDRLEVAVDFQARPTGVERATSTFALDAVLSLPQGFTRTLSSVPTTPFEDRAAQVVSIDLRDVARQVAEVVALTGVGDGQYTITVTPRLHSEASGDGATATGDQAPAVGFVVQDGVIQAQPVSSATEVLPLARTVTEPTRAQLGPVALDTATARGLLAGLALVLVVGAGWFASVLFAGWGLGEAQRIGARYRTQLVDVSSATGPPGPVVLVGGIAELARIARTEQTVMLHEDLGHGSHRYRVFLGSVTYEYETAPEHPGGALAVDDVDRPAG